MLSRTTSSTVTFAYPFLIPGLGAALPAGSYDVVVEEDLLEGLSFEAYRRTASYLMVGGRSGAGGPLEMRPVELRDLEAALGRDRARSHPSLPGDAAPSPREVLP